MGTEQPRNEIVRRFEDLSVWQTGRDLVRGIYRASKSQPLGRDYAMADQMKRSAISICSNIAEGYERGSRKQQIDACFTAKGSAGELRAQVILASDVELIDKPAFDWLLERCDKCSRQLAMYIRHLQQTEPRIRGLKHAQNPRGSKNAVAQ